MPYQNRVTPFSEIITTPARGMFMGNRGCLHDDEGRLTKSRWKIKGWVTCVLEYNGFRRRLMQPGLYTELFFLDEATALAAGHRPCAMCRNGDYMAFRQAWAKGEGVSIDDLSAATLDRQMHEQRVGKDRQQKRRQENIENVPDGAFVTLDGSRAWMVTGDHLLLWTPEGYSEKFVRPVDRLVRVLTPSGTVAALRAGYTPTLHHSAA